MCNFANIHNHTDKGSFDAVTSSKSFVEKILRLGQKHIVQTDHGSLKGMMLLAKEARKAGLRYIPGVEVYTTLDETPQRGLDILGKKYYHMLLIAKNQKGYENLLTLLKMSYKDDGHFYFNPRVSLEEIRRFSEGLIATTGCVASPLSSIALLETRGEVEFKSEATLDKYKHLHLIGKTCDDHSSYMTEEDQIEAGKIDIPRGILSYEKVLDNLLDIFGDNLYGEVQDCGFDDQLIVNDYITHFAEKKGIPIIATSDSHYPDPDDKFIREIMMRIRHKRLDTDDKNEFYSGKDSKLYIKSGEEMAALFGEAACSNTIKLVDSCEDIQFEHSTLFPVVLNQTKSPDEVFKNLIEEGFKKKNIPIEKEKEYRDRIKEEYEVISSLGFIDYFLVLVNILKEARKRNYLIGPARGSVSGSLIAYLIGITQVDPIHYKLYFSRFLNKDRVSVPDIDIDIESGTRNDFIKMISELHGDDKVCQIMVYSEMKPKGIARDLGRIYKTPQLGEEIARLIPPPLHGKEATVTEALNSVPKLKDPKYKQIVDRMLDIESLVKTDGIHAAGVIISPRKLNELIPLEYKSKTGLYVAQLSMEEVEDVGLIKYDFLGLRNLDIISTLLKKIDIDDIYTQIPLDDKKTFEEFSNATDFGGFFQFEGSAGIGQLLRQIQPRNIEDIAVATALYRPGPLGQNMDKDYLERRNMKWEPRSKLDKCIPETYGVIIYQEQIIRICIDLAGFKESEADTVRKILGKKKKEEVDKWKKPFIDGCNKVAGLSHSEAETIWGSIESGSDYLFSLNHAVAYAYLTYITGYLRTHYKGEFICSLLNNSADDKYKLIGGLNSGKSLGLDIRPPRISILNEECIVESDNVIRLGTQICKNIKSTGSYAVSAARKHPKSLFEFIGLVNRSKLNVGVCKAMVSAGVFDEFILSSESKLNRTALRKLTEDYYLWYKANSEKYEQIQKWEERKAKREQQEKLKAEGLDYGGRLVGLRKKPDLPDMINVEDYFNIKDEPYLNALYEYEILGCNIGYSPVEFVQKHPRTQTIEEVDKYLKDNYDDVNDVKIKTKIVGIIAKKKENRTSSGDAMCSLLVEDQTSSAAITVFAANYKKLRAKGIDFKDLEIYEFDIMAKISYSTFSDSVVISYSVLDVSPVVLDQRKIMNLSVDNHNMKISFSDLEELKNFVKNNSHYRGEINFKNIYGVKIR